MDFSGYLRWYFRSTLGAANLLVAGLGFAGGLLLGLSLPGAAAAAAGLGFVVGAGALVGGFGARAAAAARQAQADKVNAERIASTRALRDKLARLRLSPGPVADARQLVLLSSGEYLEACAREKRHDPLAAEALSEAIELLDIHLKEKDEVATERRFGLKDADPFAEGESRIVAALTEKAAVLRERRIQIDGGLAAAGLMAVKEDLR
jgi:hypothetical protein